MTQEALFAPHPVALGCLCGSFVQQLFIEHPRWPGPVRDARAAEIREVTPWCQEPHSVVGVAACKQLVLIRSTGGVSKQSMVGPGAHS